VEFDAVFSAIVVRKLIKSDIIIFSFLIWWVTLNFFLNVKPIRRMEHYFDVLLEEKCGRKNAHYDYRFLDEARLGRSQAVTH